VIDPAPAQPAPAVGWPSNSSTGGGAATVRGGGGRGGGCRWSKVARGAAAWEQWINGGYGVRIRVSDCQGGTALARLKGARGQRWFSSNVTGAV
jgi:hypothetical protein